VEYAVLTPYLIPPQFSAKAANIGDAFVLERIRELLAPHRCAHVFSTRIPLREEDLEKINSVGALILAGGNLLHESFAPAAGMDVHQFERIRIPLIPFGVGIYGEADRTAPITLESRKLILALHERLRYASWRCTATLRYLLKHVPEVEGQALMTGCPVMYGRPLISGTPFSTGAHRVLVTVTDRGDFWERETSTLDAVTRLHPRAERTLSLHQLYPDPERGSRRRWTRNLRRRRRRALPSSLRHYAQARGFRVYVPESAKECLEFYDVFDLHVGSRVHAHLAFLSRARRSFLVPCDERSAGFAETFDFPLCAPARLEDFLDYDFERFRQRYLGTLGSLEQFTSWVRGDVLGGPR
jgi:hypothetical protein